MYLLFVTGGKRNDTCDNPASHFFGLIFSRLVMSVERRIFPPYRTG